MAEGLDCPSDVVDQLCAAPDQGLPGSDHGHVRLGAFASVPNRVQELRIEARQAGKILGVYFVGLALVGVDEPQFASVGHQYLVV
jgi:hypothetical protein